MSDPFAIRMNFKRSYLEKMTSSPASQLRAAAYAIKYREQDEDLHSCILEQLEASNINLRANIMYFLDYLCDISKREGCSQYIASVARDLPRIVQLVAPGTKAGAMNIKVVLKVLHSLQQKELLPEALVTDLTSQLEQRSRDAEATIANPGATGLVDRNDGISDLDHETIDQRMEEDRERHKRLREDAWAVDSEKEAEAMMEAARRAGGLTEKLAQECRDDGRERDVAVELDRKKWEELGAARTNAVGQADEDVEMG